MSDRYNRFVSSRVSSAICTLAAAVKEVTQNTSLALAFYGYTFALSDTRLAGSGHLDLASVVQCDHLDAVASPYQYIDSARDPRGRLTVRGLLLFLYTNIPFVLSHHYYESESW